MKQPLQQITQKNQNTVSQVSFQKERVIPAFKPLRQLFQVNSLMFDFGECLPISIHERKFTLYLTEDLPVPLTLTIDIRTEDEQLNKLAEFVFAIRKEKQKQYLDFSQFKIQKKGFYEFVIGVKTPIYHFYEIEYVMYLTAHEIENQFIGILLKQTVQVPRISCCKELTNDQIDCSQMAGRVLKFCQIRSKPKKESKVPFKLDNNMRLNITLDLIGLQDGFKQQLIEVKPKQISLFTKGQFIVNFRFNFTEQMMARLDYLQKSCVNQESKPSVCIRKILVIRINQTNFHYHFPVELTFSGGAKKASLEVPLAVQA